MCDRSELESSLGLIDLAHSFINGRVARLVECTSRIIPAKREVSSVNLKTVECDFLGRENSRFFDGDAISMDEVADSSRFLIQLNIENALTASIGESAFEKYGSGRCRR